MVGTPQAWQDNDIGHPASASRFTDMENRITLAADKTLNLSDLSSASAARTNLGVAAASHTHVESDVTSLVADLSAKAADSAVVHNTGAESIAGIKTFSSAPLIPTPGAAGNPVRNDDSRLSDSRVPTSHTHVESDVTSLVADLATKGLKLTPTAVKTTAYTAVSGDLVRADVSGGTFAVTLPAAAAGLVVAVKKTDSSATIVTITPNGADTIDGNASITLKLQNETRTLFAISGVWVAASGLNTLGSLDSRFAAIGRLISNGTGLTGGGDLSADRTLAVLYGTTAGTAAQGNDSRLSDSRVPTAHASTHASGGSDPVTPAAIGAAAASHTHVESDVTSLVADLATKGLKLTPTAVKTTAYTAVSGDLVRADVSGGAFAVTLPAAAAGLVVAIKKTDSSTTAVTITPNGADTIDGAASFSVSLQNSVRTLIGISGGWVVASGNSPLSALDSRYAFKSSLMTYKSGAYVFGSYGVSTSVTLGNGNLRVVPVFFDSAVGIVAAGTEFTVAGDAASLLRMMLYADDGSGYPGALLQDLGSISTGSGNAGTVATGGTPGVYMNTITQVNLAAGLYWIGGAVQGVTTTQPTMRISQFFPFSAALNAVPSAGSTITGYLNSGATGAPPSNFTAFAANGSGSSPRIILKLA